MMRIILFVGLFLIILTSCHWERAVSRYEESGEVVHKQTVWTTPPTARKLDIELEDQLKEDQGSADLQQVNLFSLPRNYFGNVIFVNEEDNVTVNLLFDSQRERNDTLVAVGYFSTLDKQVFHELEVLIPMDVYNAYQRRDVRFDDTTIILPNLVAMDFIHEQLMPPDSFADDNLDLLRTERIYLEDTTSMASDSTLSFRGVELYQNTSEVLMLSGTIDLSSGRSLNFHSLSDPLPLIPIAITAVACFGIDWYKKRKEEQRLAEQKRLQALANKRRQGK